MQTLLRCTIYRESLLKKNWQIQRTKWIEVLYLWQNTTPFLALILRTKAVILFAVLIRKLYFMSLWSVHLLMHATGILRQDKRNGLHTATSIWSSANENAWELIGLYVGLQIYNYKFFCSSVCLLTCLLIMCSAFGIDSLVYG